MIALSITAASSSSVTSGGSPDPILVIGGIIIIALLVANLIVLLRRDRSGNAIRPVTTGGDRAPTPTPTPPPPTPEPSSRPGLRGYVLHGFDENGKRVRFEFGLEELREGVVIGRSRDARAQLSDSYVSRAHARLHSTDNGLEITNLSKVNTTSVNGSDIGKGETRTVEIGAEIGFGPKVKLRLARLGS